MSNWKDYDKSYDELKKELDTLRSQFREFRNLTFNEIQILKEYKNHYSNQALNNEEKLERIKKYVESLKNDNYLIYLSLMELLDKEGAT
ncbi:MAG: hypothetical protein OEW78_06785 [Nitrosopumilus sp.]|uniref:hypothetical protein n=1 Tax=Nitrosopumilus sp. TaxID=2024843 RepID=UPI00246B7D48|nr:hypothetical protein [Nitrosopumilus sp.]MDH5431571.1 hypothetical protein [Nitrosopumilus sp.]